MLETHFNAAPLQYVQLNTGFQLDIYELCISGYVAFDTNQLIVLKSFRSQSLLFSLPSVLENCRQLEIPETLVRSFYSPNSTNDVYVKISKCKSFV